MGIETLGYNSELEAYKNENGLSHLEVGRVISEHKERYQIKSAEQELEAEILGNLRYAAAQRSDFPAVGDWVAFLPYDEDRALIHAILPRKTTLSRKALGKQGEKQIIATNVDYAFVIQAVDRDFNINRMERYLIICNESNVSPIIVLSKIDLITPNDLNELRLQIDSRIPDVPVLSISSQTDQGISELKNQMKAAYTYCLLGSSGVGKSTLVNKLAEQQIMQTATISASTNKGQHKTSHRELFVLDNGAIIIDNPGMREVGIANSGEGIRQTFDTILNLGESCKYKDCTHTNEIGCAILDALNNGEVDPDVYENYIKMEKEKAHFESSLLERKKKDKDLGKLIKHFKNTKSR